MMATAAADVDLLHVAVVVNYQRRPCNATDCSNIGKVPIDRFSLLGRGDKTFRASTAEVKVEQEAQLPQR